MTIRLDPTPVRRTNTHQADSVGHHPHHHPRADASSAARGAYHADLFEGPARNQQPAVAQCAAEHADKTLFGQLRTLLLRLLALLGGPSASPQPADASPATSAASAGGVSPLANRNNEPLPKSPYIDAQGKWTGPSPDDLRNFNALPGPERRNYYKLQLLNAAPENSYGLETSGLLHPLAPERRIDMSDDTVLENTLLFTPYGTATRYSPDQIRALVSAGVPMWTEQSVLVTKNGQYECNQGSIRFDFFDQLPLRAQVEMMQTIARVSPHWHYTNFLYGKLHDPATPPEIKALIDPSLAIQAQARAY